MIDGISYYERAAPRKDFLKTIDAILDMMNNCENVLIKILLTCPGKSAYVRDYIDDDEIVVVPPFVDGDGRGRNDTPWKRSIRDDIKKLRIASKALIDVKDQRPGGRRRFLASSFQWRRRGRR